MHGCGHAHHAGRGHAPPTLQATPTTRATPTTGPRPTHHSGLQPRPPLRAAATPTTRGGARPHPSCRPRPPRGPRPPTTQGAATPTTQATLTARATPRLVPTALGAPAGGQHTTDQLTEVGGADSDAGQDLLTATEWSKTTATYRSASACRSFRNLACHPPRGGMCPPPPLPPHCRCVWAGVGRWREGECSPGNQPHYVTVTLHHGGGATPVPPSTVASGTRGCVNLNDIAKN